LKLSIQGKEPEVFPFDITSNMNAIKPKITELINKFETIDILINNAGINYRGEVNI
jgi:NADP-dependent 3-hydroxy acid dehydrogenase YdfG